MTAGGVVLSAKICPELGPSLAAMTLNEIETMIKQFIAEDGCERDPESCKLILEWAEQQNYKQDPIKFLSDLHRKLEDAEIYCQERGIDLRKKADELPAYSQSSHYS